MARNPSDPRQRDHLERLMRDLQWAWREDADAEFSNLIDEGLRDPKSFAWALARQLADERVLLLLSGSAGACRCGFSVPYWRVRRDSGQDRAAHLLHRGTRKRG